MGNKFDKSSIINKILNDDNINIYLNSQPFHHIIIDDFLNKECLSLIYDEFDLNSPDKWIYYYHYNENKLGLNDRKYIPSVINEFIDVMNDPDVVSAISQLTKIENLIPDETLEGGGMHICKKGGFLNIHADFESHPHLKNLKRRINAILFLNKDWKEDYNGYLEFWNKSMTECVVKVAPILNRLVIFNTSEDSYHGFPDAINCPEYMYRKSIALYYYTRSEYSVKIQSTNYKARPQDGFKSVFIWFDKQAIYLYTLLKSKLGINDKWVSKVLRLISKK